MPPLHRVNTPRGPIQVNWEANTELTAHGSATYFKDCPLVYTSPNSPTKEKILGTILLSAVAGHKRYAHITGSSEDSIRRAFARPPLARAATPGLLGAALPIEATSNFGRIVRDPMTGPSCGIGGTLSTANLHTLRLIGFYRGIHPFRRSL